MPISAYTVVSEFKFDVAGAVLGSETLQNKVESLSGAVGNAMQQIQGMGIGFIGQLTGAQGGLLGLLGGALSASDKFAQSQLSITQIIDSNMAHLTGTIGTLNERMAVSRRIMNDIAKDSSTFGIPAPELLEMTKTLSAMLVPKGLAGENFSAARGLSRNLLKSAPNLGIAPGDVQGQLLRAIEGSASMGDTLFRRLLTEAPEPFKAAKVKDAKSFNVLDATKRFNILNDAMAKFANNSDILAMRANTLSGVMQRIRDLFTGFASVLRPLGDVLIPPLVQLLNHAIRLIDTDGRRLVESFARFIKPIVENPRDFIMNMLQLSKLAAHVKMSAGIVAFVVSLVHAQEIIKGISAVPGLGGLGGVLQSVFNFLMGIPIIGPAMKGLMGVFTTGPAVGFVGMVKVIGITIARMAGLFGVLLIPIIGLSRALDRMKFDSLEWMVRNSAELTDSLTSIKNSLGILLAPITDMVLGFEELFYALFGGTFALDSMKGGLELVSGLLRAISGLFLELYASFRGLIAGMFDVIFRTMENVGIVIGNLLEGNFGDLLGGTKNIFGGYMQAGAEEFAKTMERFAAPTLDGEVDNARVVQQVNNYDVKMQNSFKEVLQPDRIAFTIKDQLEKASRNRTSGAPKGLASMQKGAT